MSNTMASFRKYQRSMLAVFGVVLMLVFTVGGIVNQTLRQSEAARANGVVVEMAGGNLRETDLQHMRYTRQHLRAFMRKVNLEAYLKQASPKNVLGIPDRDDEVSLLETAILSKRASDMGIVVSDEAIISFLDRYSEGKLQNKDYSRILQQVSANRMTQNQFFDAMRREMLALRYKDLFQRGLHAATPAASWDYFLRLNRQISFEAVAFDAASYLGRVAQPTEAEITAAYEEGKNRFPRPDLPESGFKRMKKIAVQYAKADIETYLNQAKAEITDEQVQAYYEANRDEFKINPATTGIPTGTSDATNSGAAAPSTAPATTPESPAAATPATDTPSAPVVPATETPAAPEQQPLPDDPTDSGPKVNSAPDGGATAADDAPAADSSTAEAPAEETSSAETSAAEPPATESPATETPATETPAAETPAADATATEAPPADSTDPLANLPDAAGGNTASDVPTHRALTEVTDEIRTRLAIPSARERMEKALGAVRSRMKAYIGDFIAWETLPEKERGALPSPPDLQALATEHHMNIVNIPLVDIYQLQETDPVTGKPQFEISRAFDQQGVPFVMHAYANELRRYEVRSISGELRDTEFLYWKTAEEAERVPDLKEVHDEVVRSIQLKQAIELAKKDAQAVVDNLGRSGQRPADAYRNDPNHRVIEANSVSWMTSSPLPNYPPRVTSIRGISYPGDDFFRSVFSLQPGQSVVAVDNPQVTAYAVFVTKENSDSEQLRRLFAATGPTAETETLAFNESREVLVDWYQKYEKEMGIKWVRDPNPGSDAR